MQNLFLKCVCTNYKTVLPKKPKNGAHKAPKIGIKVPEKAI